MEGFTRVALSVEFFSRALRVVASVDGCHRAVEGCIQVAGGWK